MATTSNYGWTTPDDSSLVKDGASAIRALGTAIDTSMNTALGTKKSGLVLLNTTSFSAVSSQSINDVFSATYENYKILMSFSGSSTNSLNFRLRVASSDNSTSNYYYGGLNIDSSAAAVSLTKGDPTTSWRVGATGTDFNISDMTISAPFTADKTAYTSNAGYGFGTNEGGTYQISGYFSGTTSFTGFTLIPAAGTITGNVRVYGFNQ